mgnify:CR=1 FL=1
MMAMAQVWYKFIRNDGYVRLPHVQLFLAESV